MDVTPGALIEALRQVREQHPDALLRRNQVGNLAVMSPDGKYLGFVDLMESEWISVDDEP